MFGLTDPGIVLAYAMAVGCVVFAIWFGITHWNKGDNNDTKKTKK